MHYTEIALIALIVLITFMRPQMIGGVVRTGLGKLALVVAVLLVARYTNRNSGILAAIAAIFSFTLLIRELRGWMLIPMLRCLLLLLMMISWKKISVKIS